MQKQNILNVKLYSHFYFFLRESTREILRAKKGELKIRQDEHDEIKLRLDTSSNALEALMTEVDREKAAFDDTIAEILGRDAVLGDVTRDLQATKPNLEINASKLRAKEDDIAALQAEQTALSRVTDRPRYC